MHSKRLFMSGGLAVLVAACAGAEAKPSTGGVMDSVVSRDRAIVSFQRGLPRISAFQGGAPSRDGLVTRFVTALEQRDSSTLRSLLLTRAEFAWLYYPSNPEGMPPYNLTPQLLWFVVEGHGEQGYRKLVERRAGRPLDVLGYRCDGDPNQQERNTVWGPCLVLRRSESGDTLTERLFGQIVARDGRYKFLSYANKL